MMKNFYFTISLLMISTLIFAQNIKIDLKPDKTEIKNVLGTKSGVSFNTTIDKVVVRDTKVKDFNFFKLADESFVNNPHIGEPNTPVITQLIEIPLGAELSVDILNSETKTIDLGSYGITKQLAPIQRSMSKNEDENQVEFTKDETIYNTNAFYGNDLVKVEILGIARDKRLARVSISPYQYNPITNQLKITYNFDVNISFAHSDWNATNELKAKTASPYFYSTDKLTINNIETENKDAITHYPTKMVIISDRMFETQLQPYIEWKTRKGFNVIVGYTDDTNVGSTTADIKNYLLGLYNAVTTTDPAPSFVLFVGDVAQVPTFSGNTATHKTDLYYCEYTGDYLPEVYYGRWSAQTTDQLQPQIDKSLEYEQYLMPDPSYLGDILLIAGVDQEGGDPNGFSSVNGNGQLQYGMVNYFNAAHGISVYEYLYPLSDDPASVQAIKDDFNTGVGFANYTAHCSSEGWYNPSFINSDVPNMTNNNKYGLMIGNCCQSATFNDNECFGEAVLRKANGGAVGYIGGSNYSYWTEDYHWGVGAQNLQSDPPVDYDATKLGAYDRVSHDNGEAEADWFVTNAALMMAGNLAVEQANDGMKDYYWEIYHLMGDPSIMNYFGVPSALTVNYASAITIGETSLTVNTEQYAYVAISQNNVLLDAQYTGANTSVTLTFPAFTSAGTADVVITKQNRQPYIGTVDIIAGNINNDALVSSIINPQTNYSCSGLTITPQVEIKNMGQNVINSVKINYELDGGTTITQDWTGTLASLASITVDLADITLSLGSHTFNAYTTLPNGVADENPANDATSIDIQVADNPTVSDFIADITEYCAAPLDVVFTNNSQNADSYLWDFGDGNTSTDANPTHTYTADGLYTVTLTAINNICGNDDEIKIDYINIDSSIPCDYCDAGSNDDSYEGISNVNFNTIDNSSANSTYTDFTSISTDVNIDAQYTLTVSINNAYNSDEVWVWIDWNRNGDFYDAGEEYNVSAASGTSTFDITVPSNASIGSTRMRIRLIDTNYGTIDPCGYDSYGEVEDYTLNIIDSGTTNISETTSNMFNIYPNPNNGEFVIKSYSVTMSKVEIYTVTGELIYSNDINNNILDVDLTNMNKGVYIVKVTSDINSQIKRIVID